MPLVQKLELPNITSKHSVQPSSSRSLIKQTYIWSKSHQHAHKPYIQYKNRLTNNKTYKSITSRLQPKLVSFFFHPLFLGTINDRTVSKLAQFLFTQIKQMYSFSIKNMLIQKHCASRIKLSEANIQDPQLKTPNTYKSQKSLSSTQNPVPNYINIHQHLYPIKPKILYN